MLLVLLARVGASHRGRIQGFFTGKGSGSDMGFVGAMNAPSDPLILLKNY